MLRTQLSHIQPIRLSQPFAFTINKRRLVQQSHRSYHAQFMNPRQLRFYSTDGDSLATDMKRNSLSSIAPLLHRSSFITQWQLFHSHVLRQVAWLQVALLHISNAFQSLQLAQILQRRFELPLSHINRGPLISISSFYAAHMVKSGYMYPLKLSSSP